MDFPDWGKRIPAGEYAMTITDHSYHTSPVGTRFLLLTFKTVEKPHQTFSDSFFLTEAAMWRINGVLSALGWKGAKADELEPGDLVGQRLRVIVSDSTGFLRRSVVTAVSKLE